MEKKYRLHGQNSKVIIEVIYRSSHLIRLEIQQGSPLTESQYAYLSKILPWKEEYLQATKGFTVEEIKEEVRTSAHKIALFCDYFKQTYDTAYKVSSAESGMIAKVEVSWELLKVYFECKEWWCDVKNITNYCKNINQIMVLLKNPSSTQAASKRKYLEYWSREYELKLTPQELTEYWEHLRSLGWTSKTDGTGKKNWQKPAI